MPRERSARASVAPADRLFQGEAPKWPLTLHDAQHAYAELSRLAGRAAEALPQPRLVNRTRHYAALARVVWDLEAALASAVAPREKTLAGVEAQIKRRRRGAHSEAGTAPTGIGSVSTKAFRGELAACLDPNAPPIERAAIAIVAEHALAILEREFIAGEGARAALGELVSRAADVPLSVRARAQQLYNVLDAFQGIGEGRPLYGVTESPSARAMRLLNDDVLREARAEFAAVAFERIFGGQPPAPGSSTILVETFVALRAIAESHGRAPGAGRP